MNSFVRPTGLSLLFMLAVCPGSSLLGQNQSPLHGTVNIVLANQNGLVAETDGQLSDIDGRPVALGQKLFKVDDHTVCTIADFYSDPGPRFSRGFSPAAGTDVPRIINKYLQLIHGRIGDNVESKLDFLAEVFSFEMVYIANSHLAAHDGFQPTKSQLTVAGFDGKKMKIGHIDLVPSIGSGVVSYHLGNKIVITVGSKLDHLVAGVEDVDAPLLDQPMMLSARDKADPILGNYATSMSTTSGSSMSVSDMVLLANELVRRTHARFPGIVGGNRQVAVLSGGKIISFDEPVPTGDSAPVDTSILGEIKIEGNGLQSLLGVPATLARPYLVINGNFCGGEQSLDNLIFTKSVFRNCVLTYNGSPLVLFDATNEIHQCFLQLGPQADIDNPFVLRLLQDFPTLRDPDSLVHGPCT